MYGPIQFSMIGFDNKQMVPGLLDELDKVRDSGTIRLIDFVFVGKDKFGNIFGMEISDLSDDEKEEFGAVVGGLIGLGAGGEEGAIAGAAAGAYAVAENDFGLLGKHMREMINDIPRGTSALVVLFEHTWALDLKKSIVDSGGILLAQGFVHPSALIEVGEELAAAVEAEKALEEESATQREVERGVSTKELKKKSKYRAKKK